MAFGACLILAGPVEALVTVVGNALAHDCFVTAKVGKDPIGGIATCKSALDNEMLSPHDRAATMVNRASMEMQLNRIDDAMSDYNDGIRMVPTMGDAFVDRGGALIALHRIDEAMADINHGLELGPTYPFVGYYNRGIAEQLTGNYAEAYKDYTKVRTLEPAFTPAADRLKDYSIAKAGAALAAAPAAGN
jgi:tetratricopeptide (TPR) repeat protein